jgi:hypothetical protein
MVRALQATAISAPKQKPGPAGKLELLRRPSQVRCCRFGG